jgi:glycosyltransferase involved in cell wall biosynthesis
VVLVSVAQQTSPPDELIIADDGSGEATRAMVQRFASIAPFPVQHAWQEHNEFRAARARNLAIARSTGDYIVFIDGDMLLHPAFIADHRRSARRGTFMQGVRVLLNDTLTAGALAAPGRLPLLTAAGLGGTRRLYALHAPLLSPLMRRAANRFIALKSCNFAAWREDLLAVNGFNEAFIGWGAEDKDLAVRLEHNGIHRNTLLFGAIAYHLHHEPQNRSHVDANEAVLAATKQRRLRRCERGLDGHL